MQVEALKSDAGGLVCWLYSDAAAYPKKPEKAAQKVTGAIVGKKGQCVFKAVAPGDYAVAVLHDENGNGKVDTHFIGIPSEGLGASQNAKGFMGPPSFQDTRFVHGAAPTVLQVRVVY